MADLKIYTVPLILCGTSFSLMISVPFLTLEEKSLAILVKKRKKMIFKEALFFIFYEGRVLILNLASTKNDSNLLTFNKVLFHSSQGRIIVVLTA